MSIHCWLLYLAILRCRMSGPSGDICRSDHGSFTQPCGGYMDSRTTSFHYFELTLDSKGARCSSFFMAVKCSSKLEIAHCLVRDLSTSVCMTGVKCLRNGSSHLLALIYHGIFTNKWYLSFCNMENPTWRSFWYILLFYHIIKLAIANNNSTKKIANNKDLLSGSKYVHWNTWFIVSESRNVSGLREDCMHFLWVLRQQVDGTHRSLISQWLSIMNICF